MAKMPKRAKAIEAELDVLFPDFVLSNSTLLDRITVCAPDEMSPQVWAIEQADEEEVRRRRATL